MQPTSVPAVSTAELALYVLGICSRGARERIAEAAAMDEELEARIALLREGAGSVGGRGPRSSTRKGRPSSGSHAGTAERPGTVTAPPVGPEPVADTTRVGAGVIRIEVAGPETEPAAVESVPTAAVRSPEPARAPQHPAEVAPACPPGDGTTSGQDSRPPRSAWSGLSLKDLRQIEMHLCRLGRREASGGVPRAGYRVPKPLGQGGGWLVYRATEAVTGRPFTVKVLLSNPSAVHHDLKPTNTLSDPERLKKLVHGCGGMGKSYLASALLRSLGDEGEWFTLATKVECQIVASTTSLSATSAPGIAWLASAQRFPNGTLVTTTADPRGPALALTGGIGREAGAFEPVNLTATVAEAYYFASRSLKKGPYVDLRLATTVEMQGLIKEPIETWIRDHTLTPDFIGGTLLVYSGEAFVKVYVTEDMVGHKLGEFSPTRPFKGHSGGKANNILASDAHPATVPPGWGSDGPQVCDTLEYRVIRAFTGGHTAVRAADILAEAGPGWAPVKVFSGRDPDEFGLIALDWTVRDGCRAVGDTNGDGPNDLVASAGPGGGPRVWVLDGTTLTRITGPVETIPGVMIADYFAFDSTFRGGVCVAAADLTGDGFADIAAGTGCLVGWFDPDGAGLLFSPVTRYTYDTNGNVTSTAAVRGNTTNLYDEKNRLVLVIDPNGRRTHYSYDENGNLLSVTDPLGHRTSFTYDVLDRRVTFRDELNGMTAIGYDAAGHVTRLTNFTDSRAVPSRYAYTYDALGRHTSMTVYDTAGKVTYGYDALGRLARVEHPGGVVAYVYDTAGRLSTRREAQAAPDDLAVATVWATAVDLNWYEVGQIRKAAVKNIAEFGAFVDLGGIDGLLHITDMGWHRVTNPRAVAQIDQELEVYILHIYHDRSVSIDGRWAANAYPLFLEQLETREVPAIVIQFDYPLDLWANGGAGLGSWSGCLAFDFADTDAEFEQMLGTGTAPLVAIYPLVRMGTRTGWSGLDAAGRLVVLTELSGGSAQFVSEGLSENLAVGPRFNPFPGFAGVIRSVVGDFDGDGKADFAFGTGAGTGATLRVIHGAAGTDLVGPTSVLEGFGGGLFLAAGDVNRDGAEELTISADAGGTEPTLGDRVSLAGNSRHIVTTVILGTVFVVPVATESGRIPGSVMGSNGLSCEPSRARCRRGRRGKRTGGQRQHHQAGERPLKHAARYPGTHPRPRGVLSTQKQGVTPIPEEVLRCLNALRTRIAGELRELRSQLGG